MNNLYYLITVTKRELSENYVEFYHQKSIMTVWGTLCNGTAQQKTLDYLGLEKTEKIMLFSVSSADNMKHILRELIYEMKIDIPGNGIALTIPLESISATGMKCLTDGQEILLDEEKNNMDEFQYSLIIAISEKGTADMVMDAARNANANGGTVVHAKGMGSERMHKFFGVSIAVEKEMLYIVVNRQDKAAVMKAILQNAGIDTPAKSIVFSLPVEDVVGLRSLDIEEK